MNCWEHPIKIDPTIEQLLLDVQRDRFYGELSLKFEAGRFVIARKSETIKPSSDRDSRGDKDGQ